VGKGSFGHTVINTRDKSAAMNQFRIGLPKSLRHFLVLQVLLDLVAVATYAAYRLVLHHHDQFMSPFLGLMRFSDLECFRLRFQHLHSPDFFRQYPGTEDFMYPPTAAIPYQFFYLTDHSRLLFLATLLPIIGVIVFFIGRALLRRSLSLGATSLLLGITLFFSYPFWFEGQTGNMEVVVFLLVTAAVWAFVTGRGYIAATCIGLAGAMKIYPIIYVGLLIAKKQYKETAAACAVLVGSTAVSLWLLSPFMGESVRDVQKGLAMFREQYMLQYRIQTGYDHSAFAFIKTIFPSLHPPLVLAHVLTYYMAFAACLGVVLFFWKIRHLRLSNQVLCLSIASILLPPTSHDYTLLHLYVPFVMLMLFSLDQEKLRKSSRGLSAAFICFAILFTPQNEFYYHGNHFGGQIKAVVLVVLFFIGLQYPFGEHANEFGSAPSGKLQFHSSALPNPSGN
jgi:hypothetical protein